MIQMRNTILIIAGIVIIASLSYLSYILYNADLRKKELDKKASDALDQQKEINSIIKAKLESGELNVVAPGVEKAGMAFSSNGKKKNKKVKLQKKD